MDIWKEVMLLLKKQRAWQKRRRKKVEELVEKQWAAVLREGLGPVTRTQLRLGRGKFSVQGVKERCA